MPASAGANDVGEAEQGLRAAHQTPLARFQRRNETRAVNDGMLVPVPSGVPKARLKFAK